MRRWWRWSTKTLKSVRGSVSGGRSEVAGGLVTPGSVERVLGDREQLDVGEPGCDDVVGQLAGDCPVAAGLVAPRAEVQLVDRDRGVAGDQRPAGRHPLGVAPVVEQLCDDRGGGRRLLGGKGERVALVERFAGSGGDAVLVALPDFGLELALPDAGRVVGQRPIRRVGPPVHVTNEPDTGGVGGPHPECDPTVPVRMGAEDLVGRRVFPAVEQPGIVPAEWSHHLPNVVVHRFPGMPAPISICHTLRS